METGMGMVKVQIMHVTKGYRRVLKDTIGVCQDVSSYLIHVVCDNADDILPLTANRQTPAMERLIHHTEDNPHPVYQDFDIRFYKLPSGIRRACIRSAIGHVQSHQTRCAEYEAKRDTEIKRGHHYRELAPAFTYTPDICPTLYRGTVWKTEGNTLFLKVYIRNTWDWIEVSVSSQDMRYLRKVSQHAAVCNPLLVFRYGKFYLHFPVKYHYVEFPKTDMFDRKLLGVDLGITNGAVCSLTDAFGTVYGRDFSPFREDIDRIGYLINKIRKAQKESGKGQSLSKLYTKLQGCKENYVRQLARWIVNTAIAYNAYGIVLEYLDIHHRTRKKGLRAKVHHWCAAQVRELIKGMAFRAGIRVFIINPKGTSQYAYDGSGMVKRGFVTKSNKMNYSLCTFTTGKVYNCDLNASYNITARYFIREIKKSTSETEWSQFMAKVPELSRRTSWTLDTLRQLTGIWMSVKEKAAVA